MGRSHVTFSAVSMSAVLVVGSGCVPASVVTRPGAHGVAVAADGGEPINSARVVVSVNEPARGVESAVPEPAAETTSSADGRFNVPGVATSGWRAIYGDPIGPEASVVIDAPGYVAFRRTFAGNMGGDAMDYDIGRVRMLRAPGSRPTTNAGRQVGWAPPTNDPPRTARPTLLDSEST